jgi:hypothetical protein
VQRGPVDFAISVPGQGVEAYPGLWHLVAAECRANGGAEGVDVDSDVADDGGRHYVPEAFIRNAEDSNVGYAIKGEQRRLDLGRSNGCATSINHLAETTVDEKTLVRTE